MRTALIDRFVFVAGILQLVSWWTAEEDVGNPEVIAFCFNVSFQDLAEEESSGTNEGFPGTGFIKSQGFANKHYTIGALPINSKESST